MLNEAIKFYGMSDIVTIMLSQKRDKEINELQGVRYKEWKKKN